MADWSAGLQIIDISNPANCVCVGGYPNSSGGNACGVALAGTYAYLADGAGGLHVIDISHPASCVRIGGSSGGYAEGVAAVDNRVYVAMAEKGVRIVASLPNVLFTLRVNGAASWPFIIETTTNLGPQAQWTGLLRTNVNKTPFDFVDFDVKQAQHPVKLYRLQSSEAVRGARTFLSNVTRI